MDPIVTPGAVAGHLHEIAGTVGFTDRINEGWMLHKSTTSDERADHSNYWVPSMYRTDLGPTPVKLTAVLQPYYEFLAEDIPYMDATALAHPLSMVTGNPHGGFAADNVQIEWCTRTPLRENGTVPSGRYGWAEAASNVAEVMVKYSFPSCWNGMPYAANQSHVALPDATTNRCPSTHPRQLPRLRLEPTSARRSFSRPATKPLRTATLCFCGTQSCCRSSSSSARATVPATALPGRREPPKGR